MDIKSALIFSSILLIIIFFIDDVVTSSKSKKKQSSISTEDIPKQKHISDLYTQWCKETKRSGSVLVGSSLREFFKYYEENKLL